MRSGHVVGVMLAALVALLGVPSSALAQADAVTENGGGGTGVGGAAAGGLMALQEPEPYETLVPGVLARRILSAPSGDGDYRVEIWALLVGPDTQTDEIRLPGAATLLLRSGRLTMTREAEKAELGLGDTALAPEGASVSFSNPDPDRPAHLRAVVVTGSGG